MPITPQRPLYVASQVFWNVYEVLNFARAVLNDMQIDREGDLLSNTQPYTEVLLNLCYANLQDKLADSGVEAVSVKEAVVLSVPGSLAMDPATQVRLGYDGYFDGVNTEALPWTLPQDLLMPMELWERTAGSLSGFRMMTQRLGGFPSLGVFGGWGIWEFRENAIWFPAASQANDLRIRYVPSLPDLRVPPEGEPPMQIPLARCGQALAYMIAAELAESRGAVGAPVLRAKAETQIEEMATKSAKRMQQATIRKRAYGRGMWRQR